MINSFYQRLWTLCVYLLFSVLVTSLVVAVSAQDQTCGVVGTDAGELTASRPYRFYLNTQDPAPCNGTVDEFQYCFYNTDRSGVGSLVASYEFTFAVFRETSPGSYSVVSGPFTTGRNILNAGLNGGNFACATFEPTNQIEVQAGDMIGACTYDPPNNNALRFELDVVGEGAGGDQYLMMTDSSGCGDILPDPVSGLSRLDSRVLHIHAGIKPTLHVAMETTSTPILNTDPPTTPPIPEPDTTTPITPSMIEDTDTPAVETTFTMTQGNSTTTLGPPATDDSLMTTSTSDQPLTPPDDAGVIAAVLVTLVLLIVVAVVAVVIAVTVIKKKRTSKTLSMGGATENPANFQNGIDNAIYTANKRAYTSDYQEIDSTSSPNPASTLQKSSNQYKFDEHAYEYEMPGTHSSVEVSYYAEVGPLQDAAVRPSPLDKPSISYRELLQLNKEEDIYASVNAYEVPASQENEIYAQLRAWGVPHIRRNEIEVGGHLGSGQFGSVEQGVWKRQGTGPVDVALKSLTKTSEEYKVKFLQEAAIMAQFRHPNVITLYGMIVKGEPVMLVVELAKKGDLRNFLLSNKPDPGELMSRNQICLLLKFSQQVALGMQYLSAKGFVHRDLAARNVLVTSDHTCKVADFGLSRDLADENYYVSHGKDKIPVKWTAPEALHYKKYSTASDVWAYGCLLYEIWSIGHKPFEGVTNANTIRLVDNGKRLPPPPGCPKVIYELMTQSWHPDKSQRPSFRDIVLTLSGSEKIVLNIPEEDSSTNPLAGVLGAPLEAGENIYYGLQRQYETQFETDYM